ncbi:MAG TPA: hypothetical protein VGU43_06775, partial [Thermoplasmata archaeon]|nr:hypothetical protein [Thermoplasmata archaeon]
MLARIPRPIRSRLGPILLALLIALPTGFLLGGASAHPAGAAPVGHRMASVGPAAPHPQAIGCTPTYPVYTFVNGLDPPTPNFAHQSPCTLAAAGHDEIHGSFSSQLANSSDHVIFPVHLPKDGSSSVVGLFDDLFIGMVVTGETRSIYNESWAELVFKPVSVASGVNYTVKIAVWSVLTNASAGACALGMNFTWSMGYACEIDNDLNGSKVLAKEVKGGDFVNVTFVGTNLTGHALTIYLNDSTAGFSESQSLSKANTGYGTHPGNATFSPAWSAACPDDCRLNWSFPFGLALGYDLCDNPPACTSFNNTTMAGSSSAVWFAPHFWTGSGYNGDYHFFSPQSDTGACSNAGGGLLIPCTTD